MRHRGSCHCGTVACGIDPYAEGQGAQGDEMAAVNIRCFEGVDLSSIPVTHYDGRSK